jgi:mRNA interferase RelE/StbE
MTYEIELKPRAIRDLKTIDRTMARRITEKIGHMKQDLAGDVKRLTNSTPEFGFASATMEFYSKSTAIK